MAVSPLGQPGSNTLLSDFVLGGSSGQVPIPVTDDEARYIPRQVASDLFNNKLFQTEEDGLSIAGPRIIAWSGVSNTQIVWSGISNVALVWSGQSS